MFQDLLFPPSLGNKASVGLFAVRLVTGLAFVLHGTQKMTRDGEWTLTRWMGDNGPPGFLQAAAALIEVVGGGMLLVGAFTTVAALLLSLVMVAAIYMGHLSQGHPFVNAPGQPSYELAAVYLANSVMLLLIGPGMYSVDALLRPAVVRAKVESK